VGLVVWAGGLVFGFGTSVVLADGTGTNVAPLSEDADDGTSDVRNDDDGAAEVRDALDGAGVADVGPGGCPVATAARTRAANAAVLIDGIAAVCACRAGCIQSLSSSELCMN
jgi:hypothetical protein